MKLKDCKNRLDVIKQVYVSINYKNENIMETSNCQEFLIGVIRKYFIENFVKIDSQVFGIRLHYAIREIHET